MKKIIFTLTLMLVCGICNAEVEYGTYNSSAYNYAIDYPSTWTVDTTNAEAVEFTGDDCTLKVTASETDSTPFEDLYDAAVKAEKPSYKLFKINKTFKMFLFSYPDGKGGYIYRKTVRNAKSTVTVTMTYPVAKRTEIKPVVKHIFDTKFVK